MKKMSLLTRKFIKKNIIINAAIYSYPQRVVAPINTATKDNTTELVIGIHSKILNHPPYLSIDD